MGVTRLTLGGGRRRRRLHRAQGDGGEQEQQQEGAQAKPHDSTSRRSATGTGFERSNAQSRTVVDSLALGGESGTCRGRAGTGTGRALTVTWRGGALLEHTSFPDVRGMPRHRDCNTNPAVPSYFSSLLLARPLVRYYRLGSNEWNGAPRRQRGTWSARARSVGASLFRRRLLSDANERREGGRRARDQPPPPSSRSHWCRKGIVIGSFRRGRGESATSIFPAIPLNARVARSFG